jgi:hypothetical protein
MLFEKILADNILQPDYETHRQQIFFAVILTSCGHAYRRVLKV